MIFCVTFLSNLRQGLKFENSWPFEVPDSISVGLIDEFSELIGKTATQGNDWAVLEHFKDYFAPAAGTSSGAETNSTSP